MSAFVVTNVRFPKEDLIEYRLLALQEGKKLPAYIRDVLRWYARQRKEAAAIDAV